MSLSPLVSVSGKQVSIYSSRFSRFRSPLFFSCFKTNLNMNSVFASQFTSSIVMISDDFKVYDHFSFRNRANKNGGGLNVCNETNITINSCNFISNKAEFNGGALFISSDFDSCIIKNTNFRYNQGYLGGAIFCNNTYEYGNLQILNCKFKGNIGVSVSDAFISTKNVLIENCIFKDAYSQNMTIYISNGNCTIKSSTFSNNRGTIVFESNVEESLITDCCFSKATTFFIIFAETLNESSREISGCCFNELKENSILGDVYIDDSTFGGICSQCIFSKDTQIIIFALVIALFALLSIISVFIIFLKKNKNIVKDNNNFYLLGTEDIV